MEILLNPKRHARSYPDARSLEVMRKTIEFFERKGKRRLKEDYHARVWYADFLDFVKRERIFATMCTPAGYGARRCALGHLAHLRVRRDPRLLRPAVLVHLAGVGARPRPDLDERQRGGEAARRARPRGRRHLRLRPLGAGARRRHLLDRHGAHAARRGRATSASGRKYYIGNGNKAAIVSTFGKLGAASDDYVFFAADPTHERYELVQNVVRQPELRLRVRAATTTRSPRPTSCTRGSDAWDAALNTVNIGKYNLGWASIGICTHALYEAIAHAAQPAALRDARHRLPARASACSSTPTRGWSR